ncbi:tRNA synthetase class I [Xylaria intraflava]|nr:tRNA synthetase class I [Xylaria intraflava]
MSTTSMRRISKPAWMTLCRPCLLRSMARNREYSRPIHLSTLKKRADAEEAWKLRAQKVKNGEEPHLWDIFKERGYVKDTAGTDELISELMRVKRIGAYVGIDPTAASLHLGHLLPLMPLFWMYMHGHRAVSVVGGGTAKVGDPIGRLHTREATSSADRAMFVTKIHYQLKRIWQNVDRQATRFGYTKEWSWNRELLNNNSWYNTTSILEIVSRLFTGVRIGTMMSRETVKRRMQEGDGMSLAEFIYPLLQGWDWWKMFSGPKGVQMQIGGSDQYGNIVAGIDAINLLRATEPNPAQKIPDDFLNTPVGFTVPLLTDSAGVKFGKSAGNAMWLDPYMTNSSDLYGYFMRRPDSEVEKLLQLFTFLPADKIKAIMSLHSKDPSQRHAHHTLAFEVLALVHGIAEAEATQNRHKHMFAGGRTIPASPTSIGELECYPQKVIPKDSNIAVNFRPDIMLPRSLIMGPSISRILYAAGLAESASDAHRLVAHHGAYVGGAPGRKPHEKEGMDVSEVTFTTVKNWFPEDTKSLLIDDKLLILRRGKHFVRIVEMVSDEEWEASGKAYPGESGKGRARLLREKLTAANDGKDLGFSTEELARLGEKLTQMEREGNIALADADPTKPRRIEFPPARTRAGQLLDAYSRTKQRSPKFEMNVKQKTAAIDSVLFEAKAVLEQKKKMRDAVEAKMASAVDANP